MKYYISDLHFGHARINDRIDHRGFETVEDMDAHMIAQWNLRVTEEDEVFILGDLTVSSDGQEVNRLLTKLRGRKILLIGNHDSYLADPAFDRGLFEQITPYLEVEDGGRKVVLSHYPIMFYNGQYRRGADGTPKTYMLYGHVHDGPDEEVIREHQKIMQSRQRENLFTGKPESIPCRMINCFCMFSDYTPLTLDEWIRSDRERNADPGR